MGFQDEMEFRDLLDPLVNKEYKVNKDPQDHRVEERHIYVGEVALVRVQLELNLYTLALLVEPISGKKEEELITCACLQT